MIVDSSVIVAILAREVDSEQFAIAIANEASCKISVANFLEVGIVLSGRDVPIWSAPIDLFLERAQIEIVPISVTQGYLAREAHYRFGKRTGHPAKLNFGDCMCYALAKELDEPLLFKGNDFSETDVRIAYTP
ncbi:MAG: type II toxin-antitoxin system VapC family toxin [Thermomicrobiales bacterium]